MLKELLKFKEGIVDILWPKMCLGCGKEGRYICDNCEVFLSETEMFKNDIVSVWEYEGLMKKLIDKIKKEGCYDIINELMEKIFVKTEFNLPEDIHITYVPMQEQSIKMRGFNLAELIARRLGEKVNKPVVDLLKKTRKNRSQDDLGLAERMENLENVFTVREERAFPTNVLLVDDFLVSGKTMEKCFAVLKSAGVKKVSGFTLARVI